MRQFATFPVGATIAAVVDFGPIIKGQWGIVTGHRREFRLGWWRTRYLCSFLGGMQVTASRTEIAAVRHGDSRRVPEDPFWFLHSRGVASCALRHEVEVLLCISSTQSQAMPAQAMPAQAMPGLATRSLRLPGRNQSGLSA